MVGLINWILNTSKGAEIIVILELMWVITLNIKELNKEVMVACYNNKDIHVMTFIMSSY